MAATRVPLVADLVEAAEAAAFLAPRGLAARAGELPLPCRTLFVPSAAAGVFPEPEPNARSGADAARGVWSAECADGLVAAGSAEALRAAAASWPAPRRDAALAALDRYARPARRLRFADGETWDCARPRLMGIVNVTPDSFSDGGRHFAPKDAVEHALRLLDEGADILDFGAESTRPGSAPVDAAEEIRRLVPPLAELRRLRPDARVSIDTRRAATARATLDEGADLINDIAGLGDAGMAELAAGRGVPVCVMHMRGEPGTMQSDTRYDDLLGEVATFLAARAEAGRKAGIADDRILLDPGLGFGKSAAGNEDLLRRTRTLAGLGYPLLVGASRKSFVGARTGVAAADRRLAGSLVAAAAAAWGGAAVVRVHDVAATREALAMAAALRPGAGGS